MNQSHPSELSQYKYVYFLGIGGIGMSALARWFRQNQFEVAGYDKTPGSITDQLSSEGIEIHFEDSIDLIPAYIKENQHDSLVILTPAIPKDHAEWKYFVDAGYTILKRSQVLGSISSNHFTVAVAGTHGKTTTTSMIAYLLKESGLGCTAFLGGITANYGTNFLLSDKPLEETIMVVEADEFDRSFLTLHPSVAVLTSTDADHLDIYGDDETMKTAYGEFVRQIKRDGKLYLNKNIHTQFETRSSVHTKRYGLDDSQVFATNISPNGFGFDFEVRENLGSYGEFHLSMPGFHNVENALAALMVCHGLGISWDRLREILPGFKGVRRRFEKIYEDNSVILIDDYAHHPSEIRAALGSLKALYPDKKLGVVFQPHLFSRTRDFALEFSHSLNQADRLWLLDIYPARELPISGVSSKLIFDRIDISEKQLISKDALIDSVIVSDCQVIALLGAGDIDRMVQPLAQAFISRSIKQVIS